MKIAKRPSEEAYEEIQYAYDFYNGELFAGKLPGCLITFQRKNSMFGYFSRKRFTRRGDHRHDVDELALNPEMIPLHPLRELLQTIVHEQVHQWQAHFGKPSRAGYHNREFADKMKEVGLMPSTTGRPGGAEVGQHMADYVLGDGRFAQATKRLLADGFTVSWLDRFPAPPPRDLSRAEAVEMVQQLGPAAVRALPIWATAVQAQPPLEQAESECHGVEAVHPQVHEEHVVLAAAVEQISLGAQAATVKPDRSNRRKFSCPKCPKVNAWGKPDLNVLCGVCKQQLV